MHQGLEAVAVLLPRTRQHAAQRGEILRALLESEAAGSPKGGLRWTRRSTVKLAAALAQEGFALSKTTVCRWLKQERFSLRVNRKCLARAQHPDRDRQFQRIADLCAQQAQEGVPVSSVATKKKELVGRFRQPGTAWNQTSPKVRDQDFPSEAEGRAMPYGIYDLHANRGHGCVGASADPPQFAGDGSEAWWRTEGRIRSPDATRLVILAESGGSHSCRPRAGKHALQHTLCNPHQLRVTGAHSPSGCSKRNPIEHRLFSFIRLNWAGRPLDSFETILSYIRTTTTATGLQVSATRVTRPYAQGVQISDERMAQLRWLPSPTLPPWNYEIRPQEAAPASAHLPLGSEPAAG